MAPSSDTSKVHSKCRLGKAKGKETQVKGNGQPEFTTQFDGVNVTLASNATSTETGGGLLCTIGPINDRS
jgi:hypothetical protein